MVIQQRLSTEEGGTTTMFRGREETTRIRTY